MSKNYYTFTILKTRRRREKIGRVGFEKPNEHPTFWVVEGVELEHPRQAGKSIERTEFDDAVEANLKRINENKATY